MEEERRRQAMAERHRDDLLWRQQPLQQMTMSDEDTFGSSLVCVHLLAHEVFSTLQSKWE